MEGGEVWRGVDALVCKPFLLSSSDSYLLTLTRPPAHIAWSRLHASVQGLKQSSVRKVQERQVDLQEKQQLIGQLQGENEALRARIASQPLSKADVHRMVLERWVVEGRRMCAGVRGCKREGKEVCVCVCVCVCVLMRMHACMDRADSALLACMRVHCLCCSVQDEAKGGFGRGDQSM
jgi:hypothetical protein